MARKVKVGIVGMGQGGTSIYKTLRSIEHIEIAVVCDCRENAQGLKLARQDGVQICQSLQEFLNIPEIDVIIEAAGVNSVQEFIVQHKHKHSTVIEALGANLMMSIIEEKEKLAEIKRVKGELVAILNSVQEAIEVAGIDGRINYVNPSFSRVTSIPAAQRIGQNIFEVSPNGALARSLRTHEAVFAHRAVVGGAEVEVVANASPIVVDGKMEGAVVVFQPLTDIYKLMEQLQASNRVISDLQTRINQISTSSYTFDDIIGSHPGFESAIELARKVAKSNSTILITGESGTGKELFAHAIHGASLRFDKPFIKVNCAAIPETLLESEFFGHEKGAFTGAVKTKLGKMELANGGTIFLDEIGDMNLHLQAKFLRVLQEMEFERVGGSDTIKVDVRIIAATNRNLLEMAKQGYFREDLYYRLNVVELRLPPLRDHKGDIPAYVQSLIAKFNRKFGKRVKGLTNRGEEVLMQYDWPGNIRELQNVVERAMVTVDEEIITHKQFNSLIESPSSISQEPAIEGIVPIETMEKHLIHRAIEHYGRSVEGKKLAAKALKISLATLYNKLKIMS
ncbi:transcriptional regulator containing PAS, AAA-type ATPase, and DNA-binding domains [Desulfosporosinus orientis DSM 765]|uniref:Transcriptional regulator containing PAS, AAA-type ATPase, and DNA-binding domains n=1 Tax=Desulfosporosinus orientis (strain ATCC 19365 / DSM 765 / NCIMB 8382 / VKM B-1628 / Singapore I) TaxID=768706 RepID=G7W5V3_DESOD|nr:sigma 54-interacting transcriptional regulator [Desulfosporosinus orientis]AET67329.1 transcriptional regulator containing PAS, AAA-type ATPase, and DNA-binding domains [Desulfosporosinus orientis DSM 765]